MDRQESRFSTKSRISDKSRASDKSVGGVSMLLDPNAKWDMAPEQEVLIDMYDLRRTSSISTYMAGDTDWETGLEEDAFMEDQSKSNPLLKWDRQTASTETGIELINNTAKINNDVNLNKFQSDQSETQGQSDLKFTENIQKSTIIEQERENSKLYLHKEKTADGSTDALNSNQINAKQIISVSSPTRTNIVTNPFYSRATKKSAPLPPPTTTISSPAETKKNAPLPPSTTTISSPSEAKKNAPLPFTTAIISSPSEAKKNAPLPFSTTIISSPSEAKKDAPLPPTTLIASSSSAAMAAHVSSATNSNAATLADLTNKSHESSTKSQASTSQFSDINDNLKLNQSSSSKQQQQENIFMKTEKPAPAPPVKNKPSTNLFPVMQTSSTSTVSYPEGAATFTENFILQNNKEQVSHTITVKDDFSNKKTANIVINSNENKANASSDKAQLDNSNLRDTTYATLAESETDNINSGKYSKNKRGFLSNYLRKNKKQSFSLEQTTSGTAASKNLDDYNKSTKKANSEIASNSEVSKSKTTSSKKNKTKENDKNLNMTETSERTLNQPQTVTLISSKEKTTAPPIPVDVIGSEKQQPTTDVKITSGSSAPGKFSFSRSNDSAVTSGPKQKSITSEQQKSSEVKTIKHEVIYEDIPPVSTQQPYSPKTSGIKVIDSAFKTTDSAVRTTDSAFRTTDSAVRTADTASRTTDGAIRTTVTENAARSDGAMQTNSVSKTQAASSIVSGPTQARYPMTFNRPTTLDFSVISTGSSLNTPTTVASTATTSSVVHPIMVPTAFTPVSPGATSPIFNQGTSFRPPWIDRQISSEASHSFLSSSFRKNGQKFTLNSADKNIENSAITGDTLIESKTSESSNKPAGKFDFNSSKPNMNIPVASFSAQSSGVQNSMAPNGIEISNAFVRNANFKSQLESLLSAQNNSPSLSTLRKQNKNSKNSETFQLPEGRKYRFLIEGIDIPAETKENQNSRDDLRQMDDDEDVSPERRDGLQKKGFSYLLDQRLAAEVSRRAVEMTSRRPHEAVERQKDQQAAAQSLKRKESERVTDEQDNERKNKFKYWNDDEKAASDVESEEQETDFLREIKEQLRKRKGLTEQSETKRHSNSTKYSGVNQGKHSIESPRDIGVTSFLGPMKIAPTLDDVDALDNGYKRNDKMVNSRSELTATNSARIDLSTNSYNSHIIAANNSPRPPPLPPAWGGVFTSTPQPEGPTTETKLQPTTTMLVNNDSNHLKSDIKQAHIHQTNTMNEAHISYNNAVHSRDNITVINLTEESISTISSDQLVNRKNIATKTQPITQQSVTNKAPQQLHGQLYQSHSSAPGQAAPTVTAAAAGPNTQRAASPAGERLYNSYRDVIKSSRNQLTQRTYDTPDHSAINDNVSSLLDPNDDYVSNSLDLQIDLGDNKIDLYPSNNAALDYADVRYKTQISNEGYTTDGSSISSISIPQFDLPPSLRHNPLARSSHSHQSRQRSQRSRPKRSKKRRTPSEKAGAGGEPELQRSNQVDIRFQGNGSKSNLYSISSQPKVIHSKSSDNFELREAVSVEVSSSDISDFSHPHRLVDEHHHHVKDSVSGRLHYEDKVLHKPFARISNVRRSSRSYKGRNAPSAQIKYNKIALDDKLFDVIRPGSGFITRDLDGAAYSEPELDRGYTPVTLESKSHTLRSVHITPIRSRFKTGKSLLNNMLRGKFSGTPVNGRSSRNVAFSPDLLRGDIYTDVRVIEDTTRNLYTGTPAPEISAIDPYLEDVSKNGGRYHIEMKLNAFHRPASRDGLEQQQQLLQQQQQQQLLQQQQYEHSFQPIAEVATRVDTSLDSARSFHSTSIPVGGADGHYSSQSHSLNKSVLINPNKITDNGRSGAANQLNSGGLLVRIPDNGLAVSRNSINQGDNIVIKSVTPSSSSADSNSNSSIRSKSNNQSKVEFDLEVQPGSDVSREQTLVSSSKSTSDISQRIISSNSRSTSEASRMVNGNTKPMYSMKLNDTMTVKYQPDSDSSGAQNSKTSGNYGGKVREQRQHYDEVEEWSERRQETSGSRYTDDTSRVTGKPGSQSSSRNIKVLSSAHERVSSNKPSDDFDAVDNGYGRSKPRTNQAYGSNKSQEHRLRMNESDDSSSLGLLFQSNGHDRYNQGQGHDRYNQGQGHSRGPDKNRTNSHHSDQNGRTRLRVTNRPNYDDREYPENSRRDSGNMTQSSPKKQLHGEVLFRRRPGNNLPQVIRGSILIQNDLDTLGRPKHVDVVAGSDSDLSGFVVDDNTNMFHGGYFQSRENPVYDSSDLTDIDRRNISMQNGGGMNRSEHHSNNRRENENNFSLAPNSNYGEDIEDGFDREIPIHTGKNPASSSSPPRHVTWQASNERSASSVRQTVNVHREEEQLIGPPTSLTDQGVEAFDPALVNVDVISEQVDLALRGDRGVAELTVRVRCERIVPISGTRDMFRKSAVIVTRVIEVEMSEYPERRAMLERALKGSQGRLSAKDTFYLYKKLMEIADDAPDNEDLGSVHERKLQTDKELDEERDMLMGSRLSRGLSVDEIQSPRGARLKTSRSGETGRYGSGDGRSRESRDNGLQNRRRAESQKRYDGRTTRGQTDSLLF